MRDMQDDKSDQPQPTEAPWHLQRDQNVKEDWHHRSTDGYEGIKEESKLNH